MVETGRDRLARDGSRHKGADHAKVGRRFLFTRGLKVTSSLNKAPRFAPSHMVRNAAGLGLVPSNIASRCASGAMPNDRFRRTLCLSGLAKVDETVHLFLVRRGVETEIGKVLPYSNALS